jgi:SAM-dependent methyltransferase
LSQRSEERLQGDTLLEIEEVHALRQDWDELAALDPFWAVLTEEDLRFRKWTPIEFFETGENEIEELMSICEEVGHPVERERALDFGCGVGRLTRPLAGHFGEVYGMDISPRMIELAQWFNQKLDNCRFVLNGQGSLSMFPAGYFDLIYTINVLQHLSGRPQIEHYLEEFIRTLKPRGLLVFQLPAAVPLRDRVRLPVTRFAYAFLRRLGFSEKFVYERLRLSPMRMNSIPEDEVVDLMTRLGGKVLRVQKRQEIGLPQSRAYVVTK